MQGARFKLNLRPKLSRGNYLEDLIQLRRNEINNYERRFLGHLVEHDFYCF